MIVIDSSAFSKFLMREENWERVVNYLNPNLKPHAVDMLVVEGTNVIWKYAEKYRLITREQAFRLYEQMMKLVKGGVIVVESSEKYLEGALEIAMECDIPIYDGLFLAQAKALKAELITGDKRQGEVAKEMHVDVVYIE